ncbi:B-box domain protein 31 [Mucuna pruriens]|uniref:B-box domain protein 31 n=1 Tax=Mucuna pruriens TaxID=157652 RepID=A0A371E532_MUCPR|nr:B-box domain protein 31 [Mucuna pruriens]
MKNCELCKVPARTFCESDQASLCWDCDAKVHGANFLVARHTRTLLCHACQSLTPWKASGAALGNTVSFCERCSGGTTEQGQESEGGNDDDIDTDEEDEDDEYEDEVAADEDGDNQVVPWSSAPPPPPAPSSSSSEESVSRCNNGDEDVSQSVTTLKRRREDNDFQGSNSGWGYQGREVERGGWLVRLRRRTAAEGVDVAVATPTSSYGCCNDRGSEDVRMFCDMNRKEKPRSKHMNVIPDS